MDVDKDPLSKPTTAQSWPKNLPTTTVPTKADSEPTTTLALPRAKKLKFAEPTEVKSPIKVSSSKLSEGINEEETLTMDEMAMNYSKEGIPSFQLAEQESRYLKKNDGEIVGLIKCPAPGECIVVAKKSTKGELNELKYLGASSVAAKAKYNYTDKSTYVKLRTVLVKDEEFLQTTQAYAQNNKLGSIKGVCDKIEINCLCCEPDVPSRYQVKPSIACTQCEDKFHLEHTASYRSGELCLYLFQVF